VSAAGELRERALAFLAGRDEDVLDLTKMLVLAPSENPPGDETAPVAVLIDALKRYGLPEGRVVGREPNRPNLIVTIPGARPGPHLALCGHTDTKPVGEAAELWNTDPLTPTISGDRLYGLGSTDMKGALAAMVLAGAAFASIAAESSGTLSLVFTSDEERGSWYGAQFLATSNELEGIDAIILGEPSGVLDDWDGIRIVSRGVACFKVVVRGTQTHSSISDAFPTVNAVEAMAKLMLGFREQFRPYYDEHPLCPNGPTINIGVKVSGGVTYGVLPGYAEFWTDVRTVPGMTFDVFQDDVKATLKRVSEDLGGIDYELIFDEKAGWIPPTEIEADDPLVLACADAAQAVLGTSPEITLFHGGTDASQFQGIAGIPTLASFGPGQLPLAHGANEWVKIESLGQAMRMYALTALAFCNPA
jgi:acetylornithine deacetylase